MNVQQKVKRDIINIAKVEYPEVFGSNLVPNNLVPNNLSEAMIDTLYESVFLDENGNKALLKEYDCESEFRSEYDEETKLPLEDSEYSRYYEVKSVAKKLSCGTWVGYPYYYGGGKHSDPDAIDWISLAYELKVVEYEKVVIQRDFSKVV